ncbi:MAG: hypothetical protein JNL36_04050 [Candidatus Kapabacteria bacterium]|nr:hypothetical protein [Candidatus Kapabacteria bacterium]
MRNYVKYVVLILSGAFCFFISNELLATRPPKIPTENDQDIDFPEEFPEDFDFQKEFFQYVSSGWLPTPFPRQAVLVGLNGSSKIDEVRNMRSAGFVPTTNPLQGNVFFRDRYRAFPDDYFYTVDPFSTEITEEQSLLSPYQSEYSIDYIIQGYIPVYAQFRTGYRESQSVLTSLDTSRSYLTLAGNKKNFTEITTIDVFERRLFFTPRLVIPIYGLYAITEDQSISSVYYLFGAYDMEYVFSIDVHQYAQLADVKQELRYDNGTDVQTIQFKDELSTLNRFRTNLHFGGGIDFSVDNFRLQTELYAGYPNGSILTDASWREFPWGVRFLLGVEF